MWALNHIRFPVDMAEITNMDSRYRPKRNSKSRTRFDLTAQGVQTKRSSGLNEESGEFPRVSKTIVIVVLIMAMVLFGYMWFMGDDFRIHDIKVQNNQGVPVAQIIGASGLSGEHILFTDLNAAASRVNGLPGIDASRVTCTWHVGCIILVQTSPAIALWQKVDDSSTKVWSDRQGKVQRAVGDVPSKLIIRVEDGDLPTMGAPLDTNLARALNELLELQPKLTRYSYSNQYGLMYTDSHGWKIRLGVADHDGAMREKLDIVKMLSDQLAAKNITPRLVDVRFVNAPYYQK
jgi:cell division septal protein FtsQ